MAQSTPAALAISEREESKKRNTGRKRKLQLGDLKTAQRKHDIEQSTELQFLRSKNKQLVKENASLRLVQRNRHSGDTRMNIIRARFASLVYAPPDAYFTTAASANRTPTSPLEAFLPAASIASGLPILLPSNITKIRSKLHLLFSPMINSDPGSHLQALLLLSPSLPPSLKPTRLQLIVPHNPHIDMLPSSILRDRLIAIGPVLSQSFLTQVCTVALDIKDNGQITIWGDNWDNVSFWEFSAPVLECWGEWLLMQEWAQRANFWRVQRGAAMLEV